MKKSLIVILSLLIIGGGLFSFFYVKNEKEKRQIELAHKQEVERTINTHTFYDGVKIKDFDVSGLTKEEAQNKLDEYEKELTSKELVIKLPDHDLKYKLSDFDFKLNTLDAINEAYNYARTGDDEVRYNLVKDLKINPKTFDIENSFNSDKINDVIKNIGTHLSKEAVDAKVEFINGRINVIDGTDGMKLDEEDLYRQIKDKLDSYKLGEELHEIVPKTVVLEPAVKNEMLSRINGIIGIYTTNIGTSNVGRKTNIKISCDRISNRIVMPGEVVSFNQNMGAITAQNGYKEASTLQNGKYVPALGGGLCQTSTTLYNALVRADVEIIERHPHSIAAPYVPKGEDAAVWAGSKDLKFRNNFDFPIAITSFVDRKLNTITFTIYGDRKVKDYDILLHSKLLETLPNTVEERETDELNLGEKEVVRDGAVGARYQTYKQYKKDGKVIKDVPFIKSYYPAISRIVKIGTKASGEDVNKKDSENKDKEEKPNENTSGDTTGGEEETDVIDLT